MPALCHLVIVRQMLTCAYSCDPENKLHLTFYHIRTHHPDPRTLYALASYDSRTPTLVTVPTCQEIASCAITVTAPYFLLCTPTPRLNTSLPHFSTVHVGLPVC